MIISDNRTPSLDMFKSLVDDTTQALNDDAAKRGKYYLTRNAQLLEDDVYVVLNLKAEGTPFEGTIKKISGQRFPDITAGKYYGVEVKSSKDENWVTLGGSVNESTRVEDVKRIFITFGKLYDPIEFRSRPYEDCLSDVVVTHYPRYKININLANGDTIFDKMNITYDKLRESEDPVSHVVNYYKSQLKEGESLWWTGSAVSDEYEKEVPIKIRLWNTLSIEEKKMHTINSYALFPSILGNSKTKYNKMTMWLAQQGIISTSMRDSFSAGGRETIVTSNGIFENVPRIFYNIQNFNKSFAHAFKRLLYLSQDRIKKLSYF